MEFATARILSQNGCCAKLLEVGGFRGVSAAASLKRGQKSHRQHDVARFRGVSAAASLKQVKHHRDESDVPHVSAAYLPRPH
jgi:hypothetical protein